MRNIHVKVGVALWLSIAAGCELGEISPAAQPTLRVLDQADEALVAVTPDGLSIDRSARVLEGLDVGDVIVSSGAQPFLRKVISIATSGERLALATEPGALTDAILDGEMHSSGDVFSRDVEPGSADDLVIAIDRLALDFNNTKLIDDGDIKVEIDRGSIRFRPSLDVDLQIADGWISHFHSIVSGQLSASLGVKITASKSFDRTFSKTIWQSPAYRATQFVGIVPVVEVVRVSLVVSGNARAGASGTVELGGATVTAGMEAGASYDQGDWSAISKPAITLDARGPSAAASATASASLKLTVKVDVRLYDVAGPYIALGAYARTAISSASGWSARAGIEGAFGGNISVLGATLAGYDATLFDVGRNF